MANRRRFLIGNEAMEQEQGEIPNFYELYFNCLIDRNIHNLAGLINMS